METKFEQLKAKARRNVQRLDACDGFADRNIGTVLDALDCGLRFPETNAQFDALIMLEDIVKKEYAQRSNHANARKN